MKTEQAIKLAGSPTALAELLSITPSAVSQWGEDVPQAREWQLRVIRPAWFAADEKARA
jgi:DNA-binding transcriptional regulator YdaS (Cro superfamily)